MPPKKSGRRSPPPLRAKRQQPSADMLLAPLLWDNPQVRRHLEKHPEEKKSLLVRLRQEHEAHATYANSPELASEMELWNQEWESLGVEEQRRQYERAAENIRTYEWEVAQFGRDWRGSKSTDPLPEAVVTPVFDFIKNHKDVIGRFVELSPEDIDDAVQGLSIPIERFQAVLAFKDGPAPVAKALKIGNYQLVDQLTALAAEVLKAWDSARLHSSISAMPRAELEKLAMLATQALLARLENQPVSPTLDNKIVDPVTGLLIPPDAGRPYRERGHHSDGTRLSIFEHLRNEYGPYLDAHLLFSGHLQDIDKPAYDALLYLARKNARASRDIDEIGSTARFFLEHGILAGEHLEFPPEHLVRQVELINKSRALSIVPKIRGRRTSPAKDRRSR